ncbi:hypothetical protein [Streptomyces sp. SudanB91_2054]|uniref:hypothetical protein n=1 Tax=Streptomyces sp. SudanB91_2054 TaxID=3035278 RepID=UPI0036DB4A3E
MFGLTTSRHARHLAAQLAAANELLRASYGGHVTDLTTARRTEGQLRARLARAVKGCARWRAEAAREQRTSHVLAEQLLDATSGGSTAARAALGLSVNGPWERAVDGLNALTDAGIVLHPDTDGDLCNLSGPERLRWDRASGRWQLAYDAPTSLTA